MDGEEQQKLSALQESNQQLRRIVSSRDSRILELETAAAAVCDQISQGQLTSLAVQALQAALKRKVSDSVMMVDRISVQSDCEFENVSVPAEILQAARRLHKDSQRNALDQIPQGQLSDIMLLVRWLAVLRCGK